ncbi:hypothetical protein A3C57_02805 [Candidatus Nomurabacteria bacterium RIFCSPHIGHO2_02_FULL_33_12]|uniref:Uncharacterized protein n=1 Tax=Candidatus Nomurabacteria bacterium RIFCSPLOWO2_01_FULL_33_17 TaxID=1801764 RepID=A0A1F6WPY7_9BACT|nr:MAG: hypothetical protein A3C57_02805 [Candidatus Nomurabacteria bacterium RIFCSPHIGHO2_02_FULL_33_12]OGI83972.1 MAG: hypothetical protein A2903_00920 [Candidatus Nomurabacteria bacterium RIFCSPLOWO2_01_FULL_33_17]
MKEILIKIKKYLEKINLLPNYSEESIFFIVISIIVLFIVDDLFKQDLINFFFNLDGGVNSLKIKFIIIGGVLFTLYTTFFSYFKTEYQKNIMFWFVLIVNILTNVSLLTNNDYKEYSNILHFSVIVSISISFLMILFKYFKVPGISGIKNKSLSFNNSIYGIIVIILIIIIQKYFFHLQWEIILNSVVWYAILFNRKVSSYLPKLYEKKDININLIEILTSKVSELASNDISRTWIVSENYKRSVYVPDSLNTEKGINDFLQRELKQEDRTQPIALGTIGEITYRRTIFSFRKKTDPAIVIEVFLNNKNKGYRFAKVFKNGDNSLEENEIMYFGRIKNIFLY